MKEFNLALIILSAVIIIALAGVLIITSESSITGQANTVGSYNPKGMGIFEKTGQFKPVVHYSRKKTNQTE
ncbi:hypothetical protein HY837_05395 [archaeon]|nr:hypothetical protein [archaeon]